MKRAEQNLGLQFLFEQNYTKVPFNLYMLFLVEKSRWLGGTIASAKPSWKPQLPQDHRVDVGAVYCRLEHQFL